MIIIYFYYILYYNYIIIIIIYNIIYCYYHYKWYDDYYNGMLYAQKLEIWTKDPTQTSSNENYNETKNIWNGISSRLDTAKNTYASECDP